MQKSEEESVAYALTTFFGGGDEGRGRTREARGGQPNGMGRLHGMTGRGWARKSAGRRPLAAGHRCYFKVHFCMVYVVHGKN